MNNLFAELRRRNVFRVAGVYAVAGWLLAQAAVVLETSLKMPDWFDTLVVSLLLLGFPLALILAWAFELTPEGVKLTVNVSESDSIAPKTGRKLDYAILGGVGLIVALFIADRMMPAPFVTAASQPPQGEADGSASQKAGPHPEEPATQGVAGVPKDAPAASIAVLPFADLSPGKDQEYFSDGMAEEILNVLAKLPDLKVAGRTSSFSFKGKNEDLRAIGAQLGVANILEGSVRKQGERIRITAQLVKAADGFHLWSETYDRDLTDVFAVQDEISGAIAEALSLRMAGGEPSRADEADPQAFDIYLRARQLLARRTGQSIQQAAILFEAAAVLDPNLDAASSGLARAYSLVPGYVSQTGSGPVIAKAKAAAERALALNPKNAEAHSALSYIHAGFLWDWGAARRETELAIQYAPNDAEIANFAGDVFRYLADLDEAYAWERRAAELDPLFVANSADLAWFYLLTRQCALAEAEFDKAEALNPIHVPVFDGRGRMHICLGDFDKADEAARRFEQLDPTSSYLLDLKAHVALAAGRDAETRAVLAELLGRSKAGEAVDYTIAQVYALLGDYAKAAHFLARAYAAHDQYFSSDERFLLPEDWPDDPAIRAALDRPELNALYEIRRKNLAAHPRAETPK